MEDLPVPAEEFSYGRSKIFIRNPRTVETSSTELFSHSTMFVKQGGLHVLPPLQLLARNHGSENTWLQLVIPSNVGNELLYSAIVGSSHVGA